MKAASKRVFLTAILMCVFLVGVCTAVIVHRFFSPGQNYTEEAWKGDSLGLVLIDIQDEETAAFYHVQEYGVYVLAVEEQFLGYASGIRSGDCIQSVNDEMVRCSSDFFSAVDAQPLTSPMKITYSRKNASCEMQAVIWMEGASK